MSKAKEPSTEEHKQKPTKKRRGLSKQEFAEINDSATRTRVALRKLIDVLKDDQIIKDSDIRSECGANSNGWRGIAEEEEFIGYQFTVDGRVWWATPETIEWVIENVSKARRLEQ